MRSLSDSKHETQNREQINAYESAGFSLLVILAAGHRDFPLGVTGTEGVTEKDDAAAFVFLSFSDLIGESRSFDRLRMTQVEGLKMTQVEELSMTISICHSGLSGIFLGSY